MEIFNIINIFDIPHVNLKYNLSINLYEIIFGGMDLDIFRKKFPLKKSKCTSIEKKMLKQKKGALLFIILNVLCLSNWNKKN